MILKHVKVNEDLHGNTSNWISATPATSFLQAFCLKKLEAVLAILCYSEQNQLDNHQISYALLTSRDTHQYRFWKENLCCKDKDLRNEIGIQGVVSNSNYSQVAIRVHISSRSVQANMEDTWWLPSGYRSDFHAYRISVLQLEKG